jgi:branched-chain amino acid transport system substrate-binding protein
LPEVTNVAFTVKASADELRAYKLTVKHLNGEGDCGMMNTLQPSALKGNGILGKKVEYVTGDTQTKSDAPVRLPNV